MGMGPADWDTWNGDNTFMDNTLSRDVDSHSDLSSSLDNFTSTRQLQSRISNPTLEATYAPTSFSNVIDTTGTISTELSELITPVSLPTPGRLAPSSSTASSQSHSPQKSPSPNMPNATTISSKIQKRTLNTLAARRYRQKRVDQVKDLESALKKSEAEKTELELRVARLEAEVDVLRGLVKPECWREVM